MTFGDKLRELRLAKGLSQIELADQVDAKQSSVARWENGEQVPGFDYVQKICKALGVGCGVFDDCTHAPTPAKKKRGPGRPKKSTDE